MFKEFKEFILRGNVLDLAIGVIIGAAFGKIVSSLVSDVLMPPIGLLLGKVDFSNLFISLTGVKYVSLADAQAAGAAAANRHVVYHGVSPALLHSFNEFRSCRSCHDESP